MKLQDIQPSARPPLPEANELPSKEFPAARSRVMLVGLMVTGVLAVAAVGVAIALKNDNAGLIRKGQAALTRNDWDTARSLFSEIIRKDPDNTGAFIGRAKALLMLAEHDLAIRDATEAIRLDPEAADAYEIRGHAYTGFALKTKMKASKMGLTHEPEFARRLKASGRADLDNAAYLRGNSAAK